MLRHVSAFGVLLVSLAGLVTVADGAGAADCLDEVNRLGARYNLSSDPPDASPDKPLAVRPGDMARSGGVIEPAPTPDKSVITPPRDAHDPMPTVPNVKDTPKKQEEAADGKLDASQMTTLQALLVAARAQAKRGVEAECMDRLREARELIGRSKQ